MSFDPGEEVLVEGRVVDYRGYGLYEVCFGDGDDDNLVVGPKGVYAIAESGDRLRYQDGVNDAWALSKKIVLPVTDYGFSPQELDEIFHSGSNQIEVFRNYDGEAALELLRKWKQGRDLRVGDLVRIAPFDKGVITAINDNTCCVLWSDGTTERADKSALIKIGKLDDTQEFLDRIGGKP